MTCAEAFDEILEADVEVLRGMGEMPLALHLRECPRCAARARAVLAGAGALGQEMAERVPGPDLDALLDQALDPGRNRTRALPIPRRALGLTLIPLAAAAALVSLFLRTEPSLPGDSQPPSPAVSTGLDVGVPEGRNVAVLATNDPDITVLWLF
jgi:hypothetical protein